MCKKFWDKHLVCNICHIFIHISLDCKITRFIAVCSRFLFCLNVFTCIMQEMNTVLYSTLLLCTFDRLSVKMNQPKGLYRISVYFKMRNKFFIFSNIHYIKILKLCYLSNICLFVTAVESLFINYVVWNSQIWILHCLQIVK